MFLLMPGPKQKGMLIKGSGCGSIGREVIGKIHI